MAAACQNCAALAKALISMEKLRIDSKEINAVSKCNFCDSTDGLEWHHIIPRSMGGTEDGFNLLLVCNVHHGILHGMQSRGNIRALTIAGLKRAKAKGVVLGNRTNIKEASGLGGKATSGKADEFSTRMRPSVERMLKSGMNCSAIAAELNESGTKTARGGMWFPTTVKNLVARWA